MQVIGEGNVDGFNLRICQQILITIVGLFKAKGFLKCTDFFRIPSGNAVQEAVFSHLHPGNGLGTGNAGGSQNTPMYFLHRTFSFLMIGR